MTKNLILSLSIFFFISCATNKSVVDRSESKTDKPKESSKIGTKGGAVKEENIPILWHQNSAEYKALCYQAYNVARGHLDNYLEATGRGDLPPTIVMDIDETILDNSKYNAFLTLNKKDHTKERWEEWVQKSVAGMVPGAREFIMYAIGNGAKIYFISDRNTETKDFTVRNFIENEIPFEESNFLLKPPTGASKVERRAAVEGMGNNVIMYIGDNLADFSGAYAKINTTEQRNRATESLRNEFGVKFILLPNLMYGGWKNALKNDASGGLESYE